MDRAKGLHKRHSVRRNIFYHTMLFSLIIMAVFSLFLSVILYQTYMKKALDVMKQRNYAVNYYIDGYFAEINNTIELLSNNMYVQHYTRLGPLTQSHVLNLYDSYLEINKNITYIYSGYETGELVINDYDIPEGFDSRTRPWYKSAMEERPRISTGIPYRDINSGEWLLATSKVLPDGEGGYTGVVSCDSSIEMVMDILNNQRDGIYQSSYSYVATLDGEIILHHNRDYLKKKLSKVVGDNADLNAPEGSIRYRFEGIPKIAYFSRCSEADWLVVTVVDEREILRPIMTRIVESVFIVGLIAIVVGIIQSSLLSRQFSIPIQKLRRQVDLVVNGREESAPPFDYPANEIGIMAEEISKLTVNELYRKSHELERLNMLLREKNSELVSVSSTDGLTGLYNRRKMDEEMERSLQIFRRYDRSFSLILIDIDHFKKINDEFGHQAGDRVLMELASLFRESLRPSDIICRWGGEEFLILCADTEQEKAAVLAGRLCTRIGNHPFDIGRPVTVSGGVSEIRGGEEPDQALKRADDSLYRAKEQGRNRIVSE